MTTRIVHFPDGRMMALDIFTLATPQTRRERRENPIAEIFRDAQKLGKWGKDLH